jgi:formiminotetrahydrofolate cyclodeaminase
VIDSKASVKDFLAAAAAKTPAPGGGSVTALVGALAAAMGEMVVNYSIGKKGLEAFQEELVPAQKELARARELLLQLLVEDQIAFEELTRARKLPDGPAKAAAMNVAVLACIRVPEAIGATAVRVLEIADTQLNFVNHHLLSDLAVCADLAMATARCAIYNVRVNMTHVTDPTDRRMIESTISQVLSRAAVLIQRVSPRIWARHGQGG